jgi:hypothetical protein
MAMRALNLPFDDLINDFVEVDKAIFEGVERSCEIIFCILETEKSCFYEAL